MSVAEAHTEIAKGFIDVRNMGVTFGADESEVIAVKDVSLNVQPGEFVSLIGPSGCGKSTLLSIVAGFVKPTKGEALLDGKAITRPGSDRGVVFQQYSLFPWLSVRKNVEFGLKMAGVEQNKRLTTARSLLDLAGLLSFENHYPDQLSGGMKQRAAIARTLAFDPKILLMDEPFGALDAQTRGLMQSELLRIWQRTPKTVIFVTHDVQEAVYLADRVAVMSARPGRIKTIVNTKFDKNADDIFKEKSFVEKVDEIWHLVREEAIKAQGKRT